MTKELNGCKHWQVLKMLRMLTKEKKKEKQVLTCSQCTDKLKKQRLSKIEDKLENNTEKKK